jgi:hypothetical protein
MILRFISSSARKVKAIWFKTLAAAATVGSAEVVGLGSA